jgi:hypothetical protein
MHRLAANKDNNITIVSPDIDKKTLPNMHYIHLEKTYSHIVEQYELDFTGMAEQWILLTPNMVYGFYLTNCEGNLHK